MFKALVGGLALTLLPLVAGAQELDSGDTAWMLTSSALVLFMLLPGLSLFYAGLVRSKNTLSVVMQCFAIACVASLIWFVIGYSLAFSDGGSMNWFIGGTSKAFLSGVTFDTLSGTIPESVFIVFQMTFVMITPALFVGGFAERIRFGGMLLFTILWIFAVYLPLCHWVWGGGWLSELGLMDFAGGTVVHISAGVTALAAAVLLGNRTGFPNTPMAPHNLTIAVAGAGMLWVGWFGFNAGSALVSDGSAGMTMLVTHLAAASGSLAWMAIEWLKHGKPSVLGIVTGMVAGLGTVTAASGYIGPIGGVLIGTTGGVVCYFATQFIKRTLKLDDSLDVFPVHGVGGIMGTLLTAVFGAAALGGVGLEGTIAAQLKIQAIGVVAAVGYTAVVSYILFKLVNAITPLRVDGEEEQQGLDLVCHDERGYNF
ncbi:MAG: ammonium transporter [Proteobacteria bacterium]|jgi:ammonium transporter, Amt family|nr:ammonium transporter [Pseudomonadota bacterium]